MVSKKLFVASIEDYRMYNQEPEAVARARQRLQEKSLTDDERQSTKDLLALIAQQAAELDALKRTSLNLTSRLELGEVLETVAKEAMHLVKDAHDINIFLYNDGVLTFGAALDETGKVTSSYANPRPDGLTSTVARVREMIIVEDMHQHPLYTNSPKEWEGSIIGIPLLMGNRVVGVMNLARHKIGKFSDAEIRLLDLLADQAAIAIVNARLHEAVSIQAYTDILTGLPNRRALDERLEVEMHRARRYGRMFAVMMMDLDGFKAVNDTYGHDVGDRVLQETFGFLAKHLRSSDFLARYGGDELTMILPEASLEDAVHAAAKLQERLRTLEIEMPDGTKRAFGLSGGIAVYPIHAQKAPDVLRAADTALYRAKKNQRGTFVVARGPTGELPHAKL
jgi:diguanylate cyclase (GGDEF)-like protein